jgi:hypothetical protein
MKKTTKPLTLSQKLLKYRTKLFFLLFFIIIPLIFISFSYISAYTTSRKVSFDADITDQSIFVNDFKTIDQVSPLKLNLDWYLLDLPSENTDGSLTDGQMVFRTSYEIDEGYDIRNVRVTLVLQPLFSDVRNISSETAIYNFTTRDISVEHSINYPHSPIWLINVNEPVLYIKLEYAQYYVQTIDPITVTEYIRVPLSDQNPQNVIN